MANNKVQLTAQVELDSRQADKEAKRLERLLNRVTRDRKAIVKLGGAYNADVYGKYKKDLEDLSLQGTRVGNHGAVRYANKELKAINATIKQNNKDIEKANQQWDNQTKVMTGLKSVAARYFSLYTAANFGKKIAETTGYFQQQQVALEGILSSATKAREVLSDIKDFALKSPFQTKELVTFTKQLAAFGIKGDDLFPTVTKLADISAGLGVDMSRIILAYGQVRSAAVLRGQELRQFTEAGIPLVEELAKKFSALNGTLVTTGEVFKLISERKVSFEMVASVLSDMTAEGGKFYKMQENITDTMYGQIQKLKDMWTLEMDRMGRGSDTFLMGIIKGMQGAIKYGKELAAAIGTAFAVVKIAKFKKHIQDYIAYMRSAIAVTGGLGAALSVLAGVGVGIWYHFREKAQQLQKDMDDIARTVEKDSKRMTDGLESLVEKISKANYGTKEYNEAVSTLAQNYSSFIGQDVINKLRGEDQAAREAADSFKDLADSVKNAIKEYYEYEKLTQQEKTAKESFAKGTSTFAFRRILRINDYDEFEELYNDFSDRYGRNASAREIRKKLGEVYETSVNEFASGEIMTKEELSRILSENIQKQFPSLSETQLEKIVKGGISAAFYGGFTSQSDFRAILDKQKDIEASEYYGITHFFDAVKKGSILDTGDAIGYSYNVEANYVKALYDTLTDKLGENGLGKELEDALKGAYKVVQDGKVIADKFDANTVHDIELLFDKFRQTFSGNATMMKWLDQVGTVFNNNVNVSTGRTAAVRNRIEGNSLYRYLAGDEATRSLWARYNPTDATYNTLRAGLKGEYDAKKGELATYLKKNQAKDLPYINSLKQQIAALELLASADYFNVDLTTKTRGRKGRSDNWRRFFTDLFSYIKEAKTEEQKLVNFSAGTTKALEEQIKSGQLKGTAVQAFWGEGSPFQNIIDKMSEYGIESKVFSKDFLNEELGKIVTKSIESTGTIDFADVWEQLIKVLKKRAEQLRDKDLQKQINEYLASKVSEGERLFGRDKVETLMKEQLSQITRINANVDKMRSQQEMFERISKSSNYLTAQQAIFGGGQYSRYDAIGTTSGALLSLLGKKVGAGINYAIPGLKQLLEGGNLNISNLGALIGFREQLRNVSAANMEGATDAERNANFERFKGVLNQFDELIKKLANDIAEEFEKLMALRGPVTKAFDDIVNAQREYKDSLELISKYQDQGKITPAQADEMRVKAIQSLYNSSAKSMGGTGMPAFLNSLYGDKNNAYTGMGWGLGMWLGKGTLAEKVANYNAKKFPEASEEAIEAMQRFAAKMELTGAIITKVDSYIQSAARFANDLINAMEANNGLTKDEYGNYTYEKDYSTAKEAINMIADFSSGLSGAVQSLLSGDIFGGIMQIGSAIAKFFENLFGIGDSQIQKQQDKIISSNKSLQKSLNVLTHKLDEVAGIDKWDNLTEQIKNLREQEKNQKELERLEVTKKHGDADKAESYADAALEAAQEVKDIIRSIREEIFGTADEVASQLTDPLVEAFRNGENAARQWRDAVRGYISDVLKEALMTKVIAPKIQSILDNFGIGEGDTNADEIIAKLSNPSTALGLRNDLFAVGDWAIDWFNSLAPAIQELIAWNNSTSQLSGGIQGITEDTARTLEGLSNSMLAQLVLIQRGVMSLESSGFATIQTSWFNDMLNQQKAINDNTRVMREVLNSSFSPGNQALKVVIA